MNQRGVRPASFQAQNCNVFLRAIPIDPLETWGGDFRDWVDGGGRDLKDITSFAFKNFAPKKDPPTENLQFAQHESWFMSQSSLAKR